MSDERQKCIEVLEGFSNRLKMSIEGQIPFYLDWRQCGVLWSYLSPAVEMLKAEQTSNVSSNGHNSAERVDECAERASQMGIDK
jgi:hypothetical protein